jgi:glycosyltransferase involved in cell wall biosynthesis
MKILIICPDWFPFAYGLGEASYEFAKRAEKEGHEVVLLTASRKRLEPRDVNLKTVRTIVNPLGRNPIVLGLYKKIKEEDYDVILLYSYMYEMNARVAIWRKLGLIKKPVILMYRGSLEDDVLRHLSLPVKIAKKVYDKTYGAAVFKCSDFVISNSKPTLDVMHRKYGLDYKKLAYVPSSANLSDYKISKLNNKRVLFNGRLIENKGVKFFEQIVSNIPKDWKFTIVGNGPLEDHVLELKKKYKNIEYLGKIPKKESNEKFSKADVIILPTFAEGFPRAILDACASGVPTVAFDVGDIGNVLDNNKNGYAIPNYNIDLLIKKMKLLIENEQLRKKKGAAARRYAEKNLSWNVNYVRTINLIKNVIEKDRAKQAHKLRAHKK